jgi:hypothetical protein
MNMMKKTVMPFVLILTLFGCGKEELPYIPVEVIFRELKPVEKDVEPSFEIESVGDTLKFRIVTAHILKQSVLQGEYTKAYIYYNTLYIMISASPDPPGDFPPSPDAFGIHEIRFDLLNLNHRTYSMETRINGYREGPISVSYSN